MAFGPTFGVKNEERGLELIMRQCETAEEAKLIAPHLSRLMVLVYLGRRFALTPEDEKEWFDRARKGNEDVYWLIQVKDGPIIGMTGLHKLDPICQSCTSGIMIFDTAWWGKGVASTSHVARTWYAAMHLNRTTIFSQVREANQASWKALLGVGYSFCGELPFSDFRDGDYLNTHQLVWINPRKNLRADEKYREGMAIAEKTLVKAESMIVR